MEERFSAAEDDWGEDNADSIEELTIPDYNHTYRESSLMLANPKERDR